MGEQEVVENGTLVWSECIVDIGPAIGQGSRRSASLKGQEKTIVPGLVDVISCVSGHW